MSEMNNIEDLPSHLQEYLRLQYEIKRLQLVEKAAETGASVSSATLISAVVTFMLLFLSLSAGFFIANRLRSYTKGFLIIGAIYALIVLVLVVFRKQLLTDRIRNRIIRNFMK